MITSKPEVQVDAEMNQICVSARGKDGAEWFRYYDLKTGKWSADWEGIGGKIKENGDLSVVNGKPA